MEKCLINYFMKLICVIFFARTIAALDLNNLDTVDKQKYVFQLLDRVTVPTIHDDIKNMSSYFDLEKNIEKFNRLDDVKTFVRLTRKGALNRGAIFCLFCKKQTEQAMIVFNVLYGAKDFAAFINISCWMRQNINEMMFLYSFSLALRHRADCNGIVLPPIYELYPFPYVSVKSQRMINVNLATKEQDEKSDLVFREDKIDDCVDEESRLKYFIEDVGLNSYYYNFHLDYPYWMTDEIYGLNLDRRGELYIYLHRQLLVRYNLERLSHGLCDVQTFNPTQTIDKAYGVPIMFHNGVTLPTRNVNLNLYKDKYELVKDLEYLEYQIRDAVYKGHFQNCDGNKIEIQQKEALEVIGRLIYGNSRQSNENYRQDIMYIIRSLFSLPTNNLRGLPTSMLQYYEIALRDSIFWELQTYFMILLGKVVQRKPPYRREHIYYYGVEVVGVSVTPLVTFLDYHYIDISNIASYDHKIWYAKRQLNHVPFNITINLFSAKADNMVIRIFLGPTKDCYDNDLNYDNDFANYVEIDSFIYNSKDGNNTVIRQSGDLSNVFKSKNITRDASNEIKSNDFNVTDYRYSFTGFPANLVLPRGAKFGLRLNMFVIVSPLYQKFFWETNIVQVKRRRLCRYTLCLDQRPLGFPFDRKWDPDNNFYPNMKMIDVSVHHR